MFHVVVKRRHFPHAIPQRPAAAAASFVDDDELEMRLVVEHDEDVGVDGGSPDVARIRPIAGRAAVEVVRRRGGRSLTQTREQEALARRQRHRRRVDVIGAGSGRDQAATGEDVFDLFQRGSDVAHLAFVPGQTTGRGSQNVAEEATEFPAMTTTDGRSEIEAF